MAAFGSNTSSTVPTITLTPPGGSSGLSVGEWVVIIIALLTLCFGPAICIRLWNYLRRNGQHQGTPAEEPMIERQTGQPQETPAEEPMNETQSGQLPQETPAEEPRIEIQTGQLPQERPDEEPLIEIQTEQLPQERPDEEPLIEIQTAQDAAEEELRTRYKTTGSFVQMIPWVDDIMMHIMDIFTKLVLQNVVDKDEKLETYEEFFIPKTREGLLIKRIILTGMPGVGKSTLIDKMAYDWAVGFSDALKTYKLVFVLKMHALEQSAELIDAIFDQLLDQNTINKSDLSSFINTNPDKVLILLDGFDEFMTTTLSEASFGSILKILNRKEGTKYCVVVTTRSSHYEKLASKSLVEQPFTHVKVLGFSKEDIEQYISKFYSGEHNKALGLKQKIQSSNVLSDLAKSPMLLLLMCLLWKEEDTIPDTMSQLYQQAIGYIFKRKAHMTPEEIAKKLEKETGKTLNKTGKIALHGLLSPQKQLLSFKQSEFEENALETALRAGIVTSQRVIKGIDTYHSIHFTHKTFQEYCAAIYLQSLLETDSEEFDRILNQVKERDIQGFQALEYLLRFCCGDNEACTNKILYMMWTTMGKYMFNIELPVKCYFEGQFKNSPSVDFFTDEISIRGYSSDGLHSLIYYMEHVTDEDLAKVQTMFLDYMNAYDLQRFCGDLANCMRRMTNLTVLELSNCPLTSANMEHIASSFDCTPNLRELEIHVQERVQTDRREGLGGSVSSWGHHLRCLKCLETLKLTGCHFQEQDLKYLAASLGVMEKLTHCKMDTDFAVSPYYLVQYEEYVEYREGNETVIAVKMAECSLTDTELTDILEAITTRNDLIHLNLSDNDALGGNANIWAPYLKRLKNLRALILDRCSLQNTDIEHLAESLSDMPNFVYLHLSENAALGGKSASWAPCLQQLKQLKRLALSQCSLTGEDVKPIAESISKLTTLVRLNVNGNETLSGSGALWASHIRHLTHLEALEMGGCSLTQEDKKHYNIIKSQLTKKSTYHWMHIPGGRP